jgi:hypothetical protein
MSKKLQRVFRDRRLTSDEVAKDEELRKKVELDFPPKTSARVLHAGSLSELLRRSICESGRSSDDIANEAGVSPLVIANFVAGKRDIHMATADRLARSLGLEVTVD